MALPVAPSVAAWTQPHTPGPLSAEQLAHFFREGYVVVRNVLPQLKITGAQAAVAGLVESCAAKLLAAGKIADAAASAPFETRLVLLEEQFPGASVIMHKLGVLPPGMASLWACDELTAVARQVLGQDADIDGHPVWNLRAKVPSAQDDHQSTVRRLANSPDPGRGRASLLHTASLPPLSHASPSCRCRGTRTARTWTRLRVKRCS